MKMAEGGIESESALDTRPTSQSKRYTQDQCEIASEEIIKVIRSLGYGAPIRRARRDAYKQQDRLFCKVTKGIMTVITTGSKSEGLTCAYENDQDMMFVLEGYLCVEEGIYSYTPPSGVTVLTLSGVECYPGHGRVIYERYGQPMSQNLYNAVCVDRYGRLILSSDLVVNEFRQLADVPGEEKQGRAGPSLPFTIKGMVHQDRVVALRCHCPNILQRWASRPRQWPSPETVQNVTAMGAFLTPVGFKGSEYKHVEWRICFNTGETELVANLHDTNVVSYLLLKMIVKDVLKPPNKEIAFYTVKNIVLWQAENNPQTLFNEKSLLYWLLEALHDLRAAISSQHLRYYMIPERNLMAACGMSEKQQSKWITTITDMIDEGPRLLLRLPKLRRAIIAHPEPILWFTKMRTELEMLSLIYTNREMVCSTDITFIDPESHLREIERRADDDMLLEEVHERVDDVSKQIRERMLKEGSSAEVLSDIVIKMLM